jgi:hypothetical protein
MATSFFLRDASSDLGGSGQKLLSLSRGASSVNKITNTVASGTVIQVTDTAGGTALTWFSGPLAAVAISGSITVNLRGLESNAAANAAVGIIIDRCDGTGTVLSNILTLGSTVEYTTSDSAQNGAFPPSASATLVNGDRLKITLYIVNVGTMAGGFTVTNSLDGPTGSAAGDTFVTFTETISNYLVQTPVTLTSLTDNFTFADTSKWTGNAFTSVVSGQLVVVPDSSYPAYYSNSGYDMTGKGILVQVVSAPSDPTAPGGTAGYLGSEQFGSGGRFMYGFQSDGNIFPFETNASGTDNYGPTISWPGPVWLRIHELSGTVYWDYSTDNITWTNQWSKTWTTSAVNNMYAFCMAGYNSGTPSGNAVFDNFNLPSPMPAMPWYRF